MVSAPESFPFLVLGNKCDLEEERQISNEQAEEFCQGINVNFIETSAKDNVNVETAFVTLAEQALKRQAELQTTLEASQTTMREIEREKRLKLTKQREEQANQAR